LLKCLLNYENLGSCDYFNFFDPNHNFSVSYMISSSTLIFCQLELTLIHSVYTIQTSQPARKGKSTFQHCREEKNSKHTIGKRLPQGLSDMTLAGDGEVERRVRRITSRHLKRLENTAVGGGIYLTTKRKPQQQHINWEHFVVPL
jgi:hypothetical protein